MLRLLALVLAASVLPALPATAVVADPEPTTPARAMWVWTRPEPDLLVRWAQRHHVRDVFLSVPPDLDERPDLAWVEDVAAAVEGTGLRIFALGGDPGWVQDPEAAVEWQDDALGTGLFSGSHVDIEPWGTPAWGEDRDALVAGLLEVLAQLDAAAGELPVEADLPFWFDRVPTADGTPADRAVLGIVDAVTVMTYRHRVTGPDSVTRLGRAALRSGTAAGKPVRLAVETRFLGRGTIARKQTFHGFPRRVLREALDRIDAEVGDHASYAGVSVHDLWGWRRL